MYEQFFGFRERPFDLAPDPRFLVLTDSHAEVLSTLEYGIASRKGITLLIGEAGLGKTTLLRAALEKQPSRVHCIHLHNPALTRAEFVEMLARRFGLSKEAASSKAALLFELEQLLASARKLDETTLLVIDEAQSLPLDLLEEIRLLANIETNSDRLLSVIIAGQPELSERLNDSSLRQFKQRIALRCRLRPLTSEETAGYIAGRISAAGGVGAHVFTREAVSLIDERAAGVPRLISVIADNALLGGFAAGMKPVVASVVREVCTDLDLDLPDPKPVNGRPGPAPVLPAGDQDSFQTLRSRLNGSAPVLPAETEPTPPPEPAAHGMFGSFVPKRRRFFFFRD